MKIIKNHFPILILITIYLITRLYNLLLLPIFTDESIYIYWAKLISTSYSHWGISLTDGKPPLLIWLIGIFLKIFPPHWYLLAGRLPSVITGTITLLGIYKLSHLLSKSEKISIISCILYIFNPFTLLYDRMALFDSLLTSMLIWSVYFAVKTSFSNSKKDALLWGIFLGAAFLSKPTAIIFLFLTPLIYLTLQEKKAFSNWTETIKIIFIPIIISEIINNLQRLSHVYYLFEAKNQQFQQPLEKLLKDPLAPTWGNLHAFFGWIISYYTLPIFIVGLIAFIVLLIKKSKEGLILFILWLAPILILSTVGREIFPRYILFTTPYFLIATAYLIYNIGNFLRGAKAFEHAHGLERHDRAERGSAASLGGAQKDLGDLSKNLRHDPQIIVKFILIFLILLPSLKFDYFLLNNPPSAPLPDTDYHQYISEHPSGYGLEVIFSYLNQDLAKGKVTLVTQGTFGLYPYAFNLEYWDNKNLTIVPRWPLSVLDQEIFDRTKSEKTYILLKEHEQIPPQLPLKLILKSEKPGGKYPLLLTKLK